MLRTGVNFARRTSLRCHARAQNFWLLKTDADSFSIDDLERAPGRTTSWDGVRNAEARNLLRDRMKAGDLAFLYHSSTTPKAIVGILEVARGAYPDLTAFDRKDDHFDPKSDRSNPTWVAVDVKLVRRLERPVTLQELKRDRRFAKMALLTRGRLSVTPVTPAEWKAVLRLSARGSSGAGRPHLAAG